ncbi:acyl-CoA thioesterase [Sphingopyxis sp. 113P3]|uniref:acyl-CoA thioesterase n=1 Tax=Sphingopyxis sp. (strain 113P3) TaxID=292913 RepID=UPI0006AD52FD|nr:acyl-CoA thioesterase domain-containing protein [Sphingopyxis sp. 113P3]
MDPSDPGAAESFEQLLQPTSLGAHRFAGIAGGGHPRRTFGGVLAAQALAAAAATVEGKHCQALHLLFLAGGDADLGVDLEVGEVRNGARFSARQVRVTSEGRPLVQALGSFHAGDEGPDLGVMMPQAPSPDTLEDQRETRARNAARKGVQHSNYVAERWLDLRPVELADATSKDGGGHRLLWFRAREPLPDDPIVHQAAITFASDVGLVFVNLQMLNASGDTVRLNAASLDHAIWFHRPARADEWLLCVQRSTVMTGGRGQSHAEIFDREGNLVATVAQSLLARYAAK